MSNSIYGPDDRTPERKALDEAIAAEAEARPRSPRGPLPPGTVLKPMEAFLPPKRKPLALSGIVENGMIRILDEGPLLPEHSRVIIVAAG